MEVEFLHPVSVFEVLADLLGSLLVANFLLPGIYAVVFITSFVRRAQRLPAPFRSFLRIGRWLHLLALLLAIPLLFSAPFQSALGLEGAARSFVFQVLLPPALLGLLLSAFLQRRCDTDEPTSLSLAPPTDPPL